MRVQIKKIDKNQVLINRKALLVFGTLLIILLNFIFASCGTARRGEPLMGKMMVQNEEVKKGELIFMSNCQSCHPGGEDGQGPSINNVPLPGFATRFRVRSKAFFLGVGRMPSFKKHEISKDEMDNLIAYLKALRKNEEDNPALTAKGK